MGNATSGFDETGHQRNPSFSNDSSNISPRKNSGSITINNSSISAGSRTARNQTLGYSPDGIGNNSSSIAGRQRRSSSLVGSLLTGGTRRSSFLKGDTNNLYEPKAKSSSTEKNLAKQNHFLNLVVKFDETVDGGFLAPYGVHDDEKKLDYNDKVVRQFIIDRKLQPFYIPLEDYDDYDYTDDELLKVLRSQLLHQPYPENPERFEDVPGVQGLSASQLSDNSNIEMYVDQNLSKNEKKIQRKLIFSARLYKRKCVWQEKENERYLEAKRGLGSNIVSIPNDELLLSLYRNGEECPICFLYFPKNLNVSRCCQQPICSECFVQIKRKDPHFKNNNGEITTDVENLQSEDIADSSDALISECASCPYCATPDFGITYTPPIKEKRTGLGSNLNPSQYKDSISGSVIDQNVDQETKSMTTRPRTHSLPATHDSVVTSDSIRPDWEINLLKTKMRLKKRFAKATTIHINNRLVSTEEEKKIQRLEDEMLEKAIQLSLQDVQASPKQ